ncbi:MAG: hypothetical protein JNK65_00545, partial [Deltaproteobacteria bacterium]|nr:hypothetical protein [Deltaproteobacteria bacterium]
LNSNYTVNYADASFMVLDLTNPIAPKVIKAVSIPNFSGQGILDTTNQKMLFTNRESESNTDKIDQLLLIDLNEASSNFLTYQTFTADDNPFGITTDGTSFFVANDRSLVRYEKSDLTHRTRIDLNIKAVGSNNPTNTLNTRETVISPSGQFVFVANRSDKMMILDKNQIPVPDPSLELTLGGSEAVDYVISNTFSTRGMASDTNYVYVVEGTPPSLKILTDKNIPLVSGQPQQILISSLAVAEIPLGNNPNEIVLDSANQKAYIPLGDDNKLSIIDTSLFTEVGRITLDVNLPAGINPGKNPFSAAVGIFGGVPYIYVLNLDTNNITILNGNTQQILASFP